MVESLAIGAVCDWKLVLPRGKLILSKVSFKPRIMRDGASSHG